MSVVVANLSASDNYFHFFGLPIRFEIDLTELNQSYLAVQKEVHPDRFARASDSEQRMSMQLATFANSAFQTLKDPIQRGLYLCRLHGVDPQLETNTAMPAVFLMQQMEWRESLEEIGNDLPALEKLANEVSQSKKLTLSEVSQAIDSARDFVKAAQLLRALLFIDKFYIEIDDVMSSLA
jgi:molecular chaperone HscB